MFLVLPQPIPGFPPRLSLMTPDSVCVFHPGGWGWGSLGPENPAYLGINCSLRKMGLPRLNEQR